MLISYILLATVIILAQKIQSLTANASTSPLKKTFYHEFRVENLPLILLMPYIHTSMFFILRDQE